MSNLKQRQKQFTHQILHSFYEHFKTHVSTLPKMVGYDSTEVVKSKEKTKSVQKHGSISQKIMRTM